MFNRALLSRSTKLAAVSAVVLSSIGIVASAGVSGAAIRPTSVASPGLVNGDFESPAFGATTYKQVDASTVPGWSTTEADNKIEIWSGGYGGVVAKSGTQFAELNATGPGALYQDVTGTSNTILSWSLAHRARCAGADVMALTEGVPGGSVTTLGTYSDLNTSWGVHTGSVAIPAGQDTTRLSLVSISSKCSSASMGNFVDAVSINIAHVPGVVQSLVSSTPSPDVVHLSWAAPLSDGGSPITGYVVTSPTDPGFVRSIPAGATSTDISGLAAGSTHSYAVAATNAVGTGASSLGAVNLVSGVKSGCTLYFSGAVSSAWEDPANWSDTANGQGANRVPGAADTVCFATSPARTDVVLSSKTSVAGIHFGASGGVTPHLTIAWNGDLSVTADSAAEVAALTENGHLSLGASTLFGVDTLTGSASIISGPGSLIVNKGGVADLSGSWPTLTNGARLVNLGTLNLDAGETFYLWGGSNIVNIGVFNMASNTDICVADNSSEGFANDHGGDLRADGSSGDVHVYPHFANDGVVEDLAGTLHIHGARNDGGSDSGSWNTSAGAKLDLDSGRSLAGAHIGGVGVTTLRGNTQLTGANISGGLDVEGNLSLLGGSKASLGSLTLNGSISGADVDVDGNFATGAGSADELDGVKLTLNGASEFGKNSTLKLNAGSSILSNGTSTLDNGFVAYSGDGAGSFSSNGNLEVGGHDNINVPLTVSGAVDVGRGTLNALGGLSEKAGADIRVSESGGVSGSFNAGSHPTLSGTLTLSEDAGSIPVSGESFYPVLYSNGSGALSVRSNLANGSWKSSVDAQGLRVDVYGAPVWTSAGSVTFTTSTAGTFTTSFTGASGTTISLNGALPSGLNFNASTGVLGGTPAAGTGGTYPLSLTATNSLGSAVGSLTLTVKQPAAFTSAASSTFVVGVAGNFKVSASGFPAPTFSASGILPAGVSLDSTTGVLSGTPSATGVYPVTITATNGVGAAATQKFSLTVNSKPSITSPSSAAFTVGTLGTFTVVAQGVPNPTFSESGSLPSGVTLNASTGVLSGTPAAGTGKVYPITITASNSAGTSAQSFTLTVNQAPAITSAATATFKTGTAGSFTAVATGFPAPTFTESGALPAGVTLSSSGVLSGTPAAGTGGSWPTTITASNSTSSVSQSFNLVVNQAAEFTSSANATFKVGVAGKFTPTATGFPTPTFTESGTLPAGVTFANGVLSGTPAAGTARSYVITLTAVSGGGNATQAFTLTVKP